MQVHRICGAVRTTFLAVSESEMSLLLNIVTYNYAIIFHNKLEKRYTGGECIVALYTSATKIHTTKLEFLKRVKL